MRNRTADQRGRKAQALDSAGKHPAAANPLTPTTTPPHLQFSRILVPIDFSACSLLALDYAVALARQLESRLILLHVVEPAVHQETYFGGAAPGGETNQPLVEAGKKRLLALAEARTSGSLPVETLVRIGHPHSEIPDTARAMGVDILVVGTHGFTGLQHLLMGSIAERVVRHAPCPVLTVRLPDGEVVKSGPEKPEGS